MPHECLTQCFRTRESILMKSSGNKSQNRCKYILISVHKLSSRTASSAKPNLPRPQASSRYLVLSNSSCRAIDIAQTARLDIRLPHVPLRLFPALLVSKSFECFFLLCHSSFRAIHTFLPLTTACGLTVRFLLHCLSHSLHSMPEKQLSHLRIMLCTQVWQHVEK